MRLLVRKLKTQLANAALQAAARVVRYTPHHFPIAYKLAVVFTLLITGGMSTLGVVVVRDQTRLLREQMADFGQTVVHQVAEASKEPLLAGDRLGLEATLNNLVGKSSVLGAGIYTDDGDLVLQSGLVPFDAGVAMANREQGPLDWEETVEDKTPARALTSFIAPVTFQDVIVGYALVTFDRTDMAGAEAHTLRAVTGTTLMLVLIGIGASVFLGKRLTRPINQLMDVSRAISAGNYQMRFDERRNDELGALMQSMNTMSEGLLRKEQVEQTFSRYVSPNVAREVLAHLETVQLGGRRVEATVLFADIAGFTSMSENMHPEDVSALLNEYFSYIAEAAHAYNGHVDKYIGDCAMLLFGVPLEDPDHLFKAVACGITVQTLIQRLNLRRAARGLKQVQFRIGVNCGPMLAGNMGSRERMEYTVVGDSVNLASRLASAGEPGQLVISQEMQLDPRLMGRVETRKLGTIRLRGKRLPVATYQITRLAPDYQALLEEKVEALLRSESAAA
ncbi:MAG: HAMP domain-containing protein [Gammaproteobacteria bacterium]|nr:HAMP domain-containing protein [Gammaproteobacteria bacterium]